MTAGSEFGKALRSLPWYLVGSYLITPLLALPFLGFSAVALYAIPFHVLGGPDEVQAVIPFIPGVVAWVIRQFFRAAMFTFANNRVSY